MPDTVLCDHEIVGGVNAWNGGVIMGCKHCGKDPATIKKESRIADATQYRAGALNCALDHMTNTKWMTPCTIPAHVEAIREMLAELTS